MKKWKVRLHHGHGVDLGSFLTSYAMADYETDSVPLAES